MKTMTLEEIKFIRDTVFETVEFKKDVDIEFFDAEGITVEYDGKKAIPAAPEATPCPTSMVPVQSFSTSNCSWSTILGASVIKQDASFTFGNAMTSRKESAPTISITRRSKPKANPP